MTTKLSQKASWTSTFSDTRVSLHFIIHIKGPVINYGEGVKINCFVQCIFLRISRMYVEIKEYCSTFDTRCAIKFLVYQVSPLVVETHTNYREISYLII